MLREPKRRFAAAFLISTLSLPMLAVASAAVVPTEPVAPESSVAGLGVASEALAIAAPTTRSTPTTVAAPGGPETDGQAREVYADAVADAIDTARVQALSRAAPTLNPQVLVRALEAHACAKVKGDLSGSENPDHLVVIDYSKPSSEKRLWVLDLATNQLLFHDLVAHGKGSGDSNVAKTFGNGNGSKKTSLGVFKTAETYHGKYGRALKLDGLEPGFNDNARERAVVIHGSKYVNAAAVKRVGRVGRSEGCPAVDMKKAQQLIDLVAGGSIVFSWYPEDGWLNASTYLECQT